MWAERGAGAGRDGTDVGRRPLLLLNAGLDLGQAVCAGTGERSHTLGSKRPRRSLKTRGSHESVYFQTRRLHLRSLKSSADPAEVLRCGPFSGFSSAGGPADLHSV